MTYMPNVATRKLRHLAMAAMGVSLVGFIDSAYLSISRVLDANVPCTLTHACDTVLKSEYSLILGIPVVFLGVIYYLTMFFGAYGYLEFASSTYLKFVAALSVMGLVFSGWFVYVQLQILHAICQYCMLSAITSGALFCLGLWMTKIFYPCRLPSVNARV